MKPLLRLLALSILVAGLFSCSKEGFTDDPSASLRVSADSLRFDTVFTTTGSVTQVVKIFNDNDRGIRISRVRIGGGNTSAFSLNADGISGRDISGLEVAAKDSLYLFVAVTINPNASTLPFIVQDSILIDYNTQQQKVQLEAYGQNARFLRGETLRSDTRFTATLPYVILGGLRVDTGVTLRIDPGTRLYFHADAPLVVDGTLEAGGTKTDSIVFRGDRLDEDYRDLPASWPGIFFRGSSQNNHLQFAYVLNAYQAIVVDQPAPNGLPKLRISQSVIDNSFETGILAIGSNLEAENCQVSNCGLNILLINGGQYRFTHNTVASYSNLYVPHKNPVLLVTNWDSTQAGLTIAPLSAHFTNNIFWGDLGTVENEVVVSKRGSGTVDLLFSHNLYKAAQDPANSTLVNNLRNQEPLFDSVNTSARFFNFRIRTKPSPAINAGTSTAVRVDLDNLPRLAPPDIGCFERQ